MKIKKVIYLTSGMMMLAALLIAAPSLAATMKNSPAGRGIANRMGRFQNFMPRLKGMAVKPAAMGKITAISGSILTISGINNTAYTVDATNAKISQGFVPKGTALTIANLTVGEMIFANGTTNGTNVIATTISVLNNARTKTGQPGNFNRAPRVNGKVTAVNGASFTVQMTGRIRATSTGQNITYTVNTTDSTVFTKNGKTAALADVTTGEMVTVAGTIDQTAATVSATAVNVIARPAASLLPKINPKTNSSLLGRILNLFKKK